MFPLMVFREPVKYYKIKIKGVISTKLTNASWFYRSDHWSFENVLDDWYADEHKLQKIQNRDSLLTCESV